MLCLRGISIDELIVLYTRGVVSRETAPWAVITPDDKCLDTTPPPPPGTLCFFPATSERAWWVAECFGFVIVVDVPDSAITWRGTGTYWTRDMWGDEWESFTLPEVGTTELRADWVVAWGYNLTSYLAQELDFWRGWDRWRTMTDDEFDRFLHSVVFIDRRTPEAEQGLRAAWEMFHSWVAE